MRLIKDTRSKSSEITEISEYDYQLEIMHNIDGKKPFRYIQYCDVPEQKAIVGRVLRLIQWNNKSLCKSLVAKTRAKLRRAVQELKSLNDKVDDKKYFVYTKHKLIKLLLEEAYEAGLLRLQGPTGKKELPKKEEEKNGDSKQDKQEASKKSYSGKSVKQSRKRKSSK